MRQYELTALTTMSGLELSAVSCCCSIGVISVTPILLTPYAVCGQPSSW